jgi:hypothetical protein
MIKVSWCKDFCMMNKRISHKKMAEKQFDIYERVTTYEGKEIFST